MTAPTAPVTADQPEAPTATPDPAQVDAVVEQDLLVEDVSIDGMCGVY
jgi:mycofactocin precursor